MKDILVIILSLSFSTSSLAQDIGIRFVHGSSWKEIVAKATKENKYIFVDCYTTWCGPCRQMAKNVFTKKEVAEFYNSKFICVKAQIDQSKYDDTETKARYTDLVTIINTYSITLYPTFLFFTPNGILINRSTGSCSASDLISDGKKALKSENEFPTLQEKYLTGKSSVSSLKELAIKAHENNDIHKQQYTLAYIRTQKNMFTKDNFYFMQHYGEAVKDTVLEIITSNEVLCDKVAGYGYSKIFIVSNLAMKIIDTLKNNIDIKQEPDWNTVSSTCLPKNYKYNSQALLFAKLLYYEKTEKGNELARNAIAYYNDFKDDCYSILLRNWIWKIYLFATDTMLLQKSTVLCTALIDKYYSSSDMDTYALILYKLGKVDEAIELETKAVNNSTKDEENARFLDTIKRMKAGEKIWEHK